MGAFIKLARFGFPAWGLNPATWARDYRGFAETYNGGLTFPDFLGGPDAFTFNSIGWSDDVTTRVRGTVASFGEPAIDIEIARWATVRSIRLHDVTTDEVRVANIPDVLLQARRTEDGITATIQGAKAAWFDGTDGDDTLLLELDSIGGGDFLNTTTINTFGGNDSVTVRASAFDWTGTRGYRIDYREHWSVVKADLGEGDNRFTSGGSRDTVLAGAGDDTVATGAGNDVARLGKGVNLFDGGAGCDIYELAATLDQVALTRLPDGRFVVTGQPGIDLGTTTLVDVEWLRLLGRDLARARDDVWIQLVDGACNLPPSWAKVLRLPVARNDAYVVDEDAVLAVRGPGVLANDVDVLGRGLAVAWPLGVGAPANGALVGAGNGGFVYTPNANFNGLDTFTYEVLDAAGRVSNLATVTIRVRAVNDAPEKVIDAVTFTIEKNTRLDLAQALMKTWFRDIDTQTGLAPGDTESNIFTVGKTADARHGAVVQNARTLNMVYTPRADFVGEDSFTVSATDLFRAVSNPLAITVKVVQSPAPIAREDGTFFGIEDGIKLIAFNLLTANDEDPGGRAFTVTDVTDWSNGIAAAFIDDVNGEVVVVPEADFNGPATITYQITNSAGRSATAIARIYFEPVNDAPVANEDGPYTIQASTPLLIPISDLLTNDTDIDGDNLEITAVGFAAGAPGATAELQDTDGDGTPDAVRVAVPAGLAGQDIVMLYTLADTGMPVLTDTGQVVIRVTAAPPQASDDEFATDRMSLTIPFDQLTANDDVRGGPPLSITGIRPMFGDSSEDVSVAIDYAARTLTLTKRDFDLRLPVLKLIYDAANAVGTTSANIFVTFNDGEPPRPEALPDTFSLSSGQTTLVIPFSSLTGNDRPNAPGGVTVTAAFSPGAGQGTATYDAAAGAIIFAPAAGFAGDAEFDYLIVNSLGGTARGTVTVTVPPASPPVDPIADPVKPVAIPDMGSVIGP